MSEVTHKQTHKQTNKQHEVNKVLVLHVRATVNDSFIVICLPRG